MGFFSNLFGGKSETDSVDQFVESQWTSGLTRHYSAEEASECIEQFTGVKVGPGHAIQAIERVRARHGWKPRSFDSYYPDEEEE